MIYLFLTLGINIRAIMDANFRRKTGTRIKDSLYKLVANGKATNPVLTYGYKKDEKGYIIVDEEEAEIVKRIFKRSTILYSLKILL